MEGVSVLYSPPGNLWRLKFRSISQGPVSGLYSLVAKIVLGETMTSPAFHTVLLWAADSGFIFQWAKTSSLDFVV